jgi:hypothetical protein
MRLRGLPTSTALVHADENADTRSRSPSRHLAVKRVKIAVFRFFLDRRVEVVAMANR